MLYLCRDATKIAPQWYAKGIERVLTAYKTLFRNLKTELAYSSICVMNLFSAAECMIYM